MITEKKNIISLQEIYLSLKSNSGSVRILNKINLDLKFGETLSILGPSGAGKTSLLMIIAGLEKISNGKIIFDGEDITKFSEDKLTNIRRMKIGIIFQSFKLIPSMTALQNVSIPLELISSQNIKKIATESLNSVGLKNRVNHLPDQLSGGEQQRVAIARAIVHKPKLILADEPSGNLDSKTGEIVIDELFNASKSVNSSLIIVTHDKKIAKKCHRTINIHDGKIIKNYSN